MAKERWALRHRYLEWFYNGSQNTDIISISKNSPSQVNRKFIFNTIKEAETFRNSKGLFDNGLKT